jgi:hypothetical protein
MECPIKIMGLFPVYGIQVGLVMKHVKAGLTMLAILSVLRSSSRFSANVLNRPVELLKIFAS